MIPEKCKKIVNGKVCAAPGNETLITRAHEKGYEQQTINTRDGIITIITGNGEWKATSKNAGKGVVMFESDSF